MDPVPAQDQVDSGIVTRWEVLAGDPSDDRQWSTCLELHHKLFGHPPDQAGSDRGVHSPTNERVDQEKGIKSNKKFTGKIISGMRDIGCIPDFGFSLRASQKKEMAKQHFHRRAHEMLTVCEPCEK